MECYLDEFNSYKDMIDFIQEFRCDKLYSFYDYRNKKYILIYK